MENVWITLITVLGSGLTALIGYIIWKGKQNKIAKQRQDEEKIKEQNYIKELRYRNAQLKELCNYIAGAVDVLNQDTINVTPEIRENFKEFAERYHSLDLTKVEKEK